MKRALLPLLFVLLLPLAACDSSDDGDGDGPGSIPGATSDNRVTWRAGGTSYTVQGDGQSGNPTGGAAAGTYTANGVNGQGQLSLLATAVQGTTPSVLTIAAVGIAGEGTFTLAQGDGNLLSFTRNVVSGTSVTTTTYVGGSGSLTVSQLTDTGMRGTFSFDAANPDDASDAVSISSGTFAVAFPQ